MSEEDGRLLRVRAETAVRDVHPGAGQPVRMTRVDRLLQNPGRFPSEDDPELANHRGPEFLTSVHGPEPEIFERCEPPFRHHFRDVRGLKLCVRRDPCRCWVIVRLATLVRQPIQRKMGREPPPRGRVLQKNGTELEPEPFLLARVERTRVMLGQGIDSCRQFPCGFLRDAP